MDHQIFTFKEGLLWPHILPFGYYKKVRITYPQSIIVHLASSGFPILTILLTTSVFEFRPPGIWAIWLSIPFGILMRAPIVAFLVNHFRNPSNNA